MNDHESPYREDLGIIRFERKLLPFFNKGFLKIYIDERQVGGIGNGKIEEYRVLAGSHSIYLKLDFMTSNRLEISVTSGQVISLSCGIKYLGTKPYIEKTSTSRTNRVHPNFVIGRKAHI